eukprot:TRINITY_DN705_c0_g1_i1.p1 TRINITY_DN705_c0_g1~~TRINITY_DN705_c0_g1_i1.p1  ORF type:complete len:702 (-),score=104.98 TRINITY_DN705_c0_g1_i1:133-2238(-)
MTTVTSTNATSNVVQKKNGSGALGACNFCRKMHSSCEGRPRCNNCVIRGIECVFMEKKKPGPPLGYKKRKNSNSSNSTGGNADKKVKKSSEVISTKPMSIPAMERALNEPLIVNTVRPTANQAANKTPTVTIRANPNVSTSSPMPVYQTPPQNPIQQPSPAGYQADYYLKDPLAYPYARQFFPEMNFGTGSPSSPFSMYYHQYTPDCLCSPSENTLPMSPSGFSPLPSTIPASPVTPISTPTSPASPASQSSSSSSALTTKENKDGSPSPSLEITLPAFRRSRIDPDRFLGAASPYAQYMEVFQRMYKDDVLGIFTFVDIPPLEYILPLSGMSREGKLDQILLFTVLCLGALGSGDQKQSLCLSDSAFKLADDYLQDERRKRKGPLSKKELLQECISFLLLSVIDHATGNWTRAPQIARYIYDLSNELFEDTKSLDHTTGWMVAHINAKSKFFFPREERIRKFQHFLSSLPNADPGVRLFTMFSGVLDQVLEVCVMSNDLSASDFGWMQSLVNQAEDLLVYLNTIPPYGESYFRKSYSAIFCAIRAVMLHLTGCYNSASTTATNASYQLIDCGADSCPLFFGIPVTLALVAKIHCFNNNTAMLQTCMTALKEYEVRFPSVKHFYVGLEIPTADNPTTGWFPELRLLVNKLREAASSLQGGDRLTLPDLHPRPKLNQSAEIPIPPPKSIMSYMDSIFECDWL